MSKPDNETAADYLFFLANEWTPSGGFIDRMKAKGAEVTPNALILGRAMLKAASDQLRAGRHLDWQKMQEEKG